MNRISCAEFQESVHELVRLELTDPDFRDTAFAHARACPDCAARLDAAQSLAESSELLREEVCTSEAPPHLEAGLLTAFREQHRHARSRKQFTNIMALAAAAACLAFAGWLSYAKWLRTPASMPPVTASAQSAQPNGSFQPAELPGASSHAVTDNDQLADFVPVPFADESAPDDPGIIVRVQLTRAALGKLGYQVEKGKGMELVNADFWVGEDGWPRAVRLEQ